MNVINRYFQVIVTDMPWQTSDQLNMSETPRGAAANYKTMSIKELSDLPIANFADSEGCILAQWILGSMIQEGLDIMKSYNFFQKQIYVWVKTKKNPLGDLTDLIKSSSKDIAKSNYKHFITEIIRIINNGVNLTSILSFYMGRLFRQTHECCLIGINNTKIYKRLENKSQRSVSFSPNLKHSAKPEHLQDSLDLMFPDKEFNKIELFARRQRPGYFCLGNESPMTLNEDIKDSLKRLSELTDEEFIKIKEIINNYDGTQDKDLRKIWQGK